MKRNLLILFVLGVFFFLLENTYAGVVLEFRIHPETQIVAGKSVIPHGLLNQAIRLEEKEFFERAAKGDFKTVVISYSDSAGLDFRFLGVGKRLLYTPKSLNIIAEKIGVPVLRYVSAKIKPPRVEHGVVSFIVEIKSKNSLQFLVPEIENLMFIIIPVVTPVCLAYLGWRLVIYLLEP